MASQSVGWSVSQSVGALEAHRQTRRSRGPQTDSALSRPTDRLGALEAHRQTRRSRGPQTDSALSRPTDRLGALEAHRQTRQRGEDVAALSLAAQSIANFDEMWG
eukprot:Selendium_serpulae@DN6258_c1_g1_i4.p3